MTTAVALRRGAAAPRGTARLESPADHEQSERARPGRAYLFTFAGLCLISVLARTWLLAGSGAPAGIDGGAWLAFGHDLLGGGTRIGGATYPPVVPLLVTGAAALLGPTLGVALVAAASASAPAAGVFMLLRWAGLRWGAVVLAAPLLAASATGEVAAWGGYPQLIATGSAPLGLWLLDRWLDQGDRRSLLGAALLGAWVLATSHFGALPAGIGAAAVAGWRLGVAPERRVLLRRIGAACGIGFALALPLGPVYARLLPAVLGSRNAEPALATVSWSELPSRFAEMHGAASIVWALGLGLAVAALLGPGRDGGALWVVATALVIGTVGAFALTREPRLLADVPIVVAVGLGLWLSKRPTISLSVSRLGAAALAPAIAAVVAAGIWSAAATRERYAVLDAPLALAIEWIGEGTPTGSIVLVSSLHDAPLGWWVEGLAERAAITGAPLRWLTFPAQRELAAEANRIFFEIGIPTEASMHRARSLGADYVLIPKDSLAHDADRVRAYLRGDAPAFENAAAVVLVVPGPNPSEGSP